jgi:hypothetical protein
VAVGLYNSIQSSLSPYASVGPDILEHEYSLINTCELIEKQVNTMRATEDNSFISFFKESILKKIFPKTQFFSKYIVKNCNFEIKNVKLIIN